jgi:hypothetical protein
MYYSPHFSLSFLFLLTDCDSLSNSIPASQPLQRRIDSQRRRRKAVEIKMPFFCALRFPGFELKRENEMFEKASFAPLSITTMPMQANTVPLR